MVLPIEIRNAMKRATKLQVETMIAREVTPESQAAKRWKFKSIADFHFGHFVGMMETIHSNGFEQFTKQKPNHEEMDEIREIIEEEGKPFREYLETLESDKS